MQERADEIYAKVCSFYKTPQESVMMHNLSFSFDEEGSLEVSCPSAFMRHNAKRYEGAFGKIASECLDRKVHVVFNISELRRPVEKKTAPVQMVLPSTVSPDAKGLNPRYTFDEFVVGKCNSFAHSASMAIVDGSRGYNPLFFYSEIGLGKSHISHAIGNGSVANKSKKKIVYTTAREFASDYVVSCKNGTMDCFRKAYGSKIDLLFIDDIHLMSGKEKTQQELSCVMDDLIAKDCQVVLSGYRPPLAIQLEKGLRSRLASGLVISIASPDTRTRFDITMKKAEKLGIVLSDQVAEYIGDNITTNIRDIESAVTTISAMATLMKQNITLSLAREMLEGRLEKTRRQTDMTFIQNFVAKHYNISTDCLVSNLRKRDYLYPRQLAMFLCKKYSHETLEAIGQAFNKKHTTVMHSLEVIEESYRNNIQVKREIDFLVDALISCQD